MRHQTHFIFKFRDIRNPGESYFTFEFGEDLVFWKFSRLVSELKEADCRRQRAAAALMQAVADQIFRDAELNGGNNVGGTKRGEDGGAVHGSELEEVQRSEHGEERGSLVGHARGPELGVAHGCEVGEARDGEHQEERGEDDGEDSNEALNEGDDQGRAGAVETSASE